jgi:LAS superfamily LD-carboxypeptidase LdcB
MQSRRNFISQSILIACSLPSFAKNWANNLYNESSIIDELLGLKEPFLEGDFFCLRKEPWNAYQEMRFEAEKEGIKMWCTSAYRSFEYQKGIWNNKFITIKKQSPNLSCEQILDKITEYSSLPGTSRHHWGTDIDIIDSFGYPNENPLKKENFELGGEYQFFAYWLSQNASKFGFYLTYDNNPKRTGFAYEPWHYSYAPLSKMYIKIFKEIDYSLKIDHFKIKGNECINKVFLQKYYEKYVFGINETLL